MANVFDQFDARPSSGNVFDQFDTRKQADPQIGNPQELTFGEKYVGPLIDAAWRGITGQPGLDQIAGGNIRGSTVGRVMQGAADPGVAIVQMGANAVSPLVNQERTLSSLITGQNPTLANRVNSAVADEEKQYQAARAEAGSSGFDPARLAGNVGMTTFMGGAMPAVSGGPLTQSAVAGAGYGALTPVTNGGDKYWTDKAKAVAIGAATAPATTLLGQILGRVVSSKASVNPDLQALKEEGVSPTIGQALGGWANAAEEKLQSVPILGDAIAAARRGSFKDFNNAAINRTQAPIGASVEGAGQGAIAKAGDNLSQAYNDALGAVNHVNFDTPQFNQSLGQLQSMAQGLSPQLADKFNNTVSNTVLRKMSPNGSILGSDLKAVDSELGQLASKYQGSSVASEQEFGDAVRQLQGNVMDQVKRSYPDLADKLNAADAGWANLVRVERAGASAVNNGGVFTPAQLGNAVRRSDQSVRDRATARGEALMQDLSTAGQNVLGNRVADSGTVGRALMAGGAAATGIVNPAIPLSLIGGAAVYSRPVQNALVALIAKRPESAPAVANYLRQITQAGGAVTVPMVERFAQ